jgi:tellurium resistance protein TerD
MAIILEKGKSQDLSISKIRIGLGWEPNEDKSDYPYDLDVSAFMLGANHKIPADDYLVFYNSDKRVAPNNLLFLEPQSESKYPPFEEEVNNEMKMVSSYEHWRRKTRPVDPEFSTYGSIDDMDGEVSDGGDDETMNIDLKKVAPQINQIIIAVSIYEFSKRRQNFGQVDDSYISIYNEVANSREPLYKYELNEDFSNCTAIEFVKIFRVGTQWKVEAIGIGHNGGLQDLLNNYN